ncbi:type II toxin-antitoxin system RelE/ParE family toxin [Chelatococcus sambhunathii]|uniref:Type II toxin-antitoxin system RelE/ParE family toxin n=1 Tax=Chelatococcus sambhunathii TaxID=363953 RepID=A0ABU1DKC6_9HYPH|nr:type II toxin-antitoxin system RelE/ParE family toxin [Chelatococcus sambhunathii]MDR4308587.1 type II toxin-antitoxin system RelE/ParE family toxin [Chelatococcus sambhunathii]
MHAVLTTPVFEADAKAAGLGEDEIMEMVVYLSENPQAGDVIPGTGGARKLRFAGRGKGKSGGYRTIHFFAGDDVPIFLLALVDKGGRADLSQRERNLLSKELAGLASDYREGVAARVALMKRRR